MEIKEVYQESKEQSVFENYYLFFYFFFNNCIM